MARLDDIDIDIRNAVLRANATDREEIARILRYLYRLSEKLKWWQTKLDRGNLTEEERKVYEGLITGAEEAAERIRELETGAEEAAERIRELETGKVDSDQMADAMHNGLLSMLDWPKLQFSMIPKNIDLDTYALGMGMYFASTYNVSTLTHYPTSEESVLLCIGEPDYQYQLVMEVDSSTPKIYGRPVYFYEPRTAWKQLHWFDTATASSDGLMSAADKTRLDELEVGSRNLLLNSAKRVPEWYANATGTITPNQTVSEWGCTDAYRVQGSPGTSALFGFIGGEMANNENTSIAGQNYVTSVYIKNVSVNRMHIRTNPVGTPAYFTIEPNETKRAVINSSGNGSNYLQIQFVAKDYNSSFDFYFWHPQIEHGTMVTDWTPAVEDYAGEASVAFSSIRNTGNTTEGSGTLRRIGKVVCLNFSTTIKNALAVNTWLSVGTLPSGYRPSEGFSFIACTTGTNTTFLRGFLWANDGNIGVQTPVAFSAGMQIRGSVTYFVA